MADAPWVAISIDYWRNPKVTSAGFLASTMNLAAIAYCAEQLTDGFVPYGIVRVLAAPMQDYAYDPPMPQGALCGPGPVHESPEDLADRLVLANLWEEVEGGWQIVNYLKHQPSRAEVEARKQQAREAGRKGGLARAQASAQVSAKRPAKRSLEAPPKQNASGSQAPVPAPIPTDQPNCETLLLTASGEPTSTTPFDRFWEWYPRKVGKAAARKAYDRAARTAGHDAILAGVIRYADDWTRDPTFTAHPQTWLNQGRWEDEGPVRPPSNVTPMRTGRVAEGDAILAEAFQRGAQQRPELGA